MIHKKEIMRSEEGFTLIEAILSLLVLGIMGAVVGFGFSIMAQVYVNNTNMVTVTTKTVVAMERLRKEFLHIKTVDGTTYDPVTKNTSITFTNAETPPRTSVVSCSGGVLYFNGFPLLDEIQAFSLTYYDDYVASGQTTWIPSSRMIGINLAMMPTQGSTNVFNYETRIMPRNL